MPATARKTQKSANWHPLASLPTSSQWSLTSENAAHNSAEGGDKVNEGAALFAVLDQHWSKLVDEEDTRQSGLTQGLKAVAKLLLVPSDSKLVRLYFLEKRQ